MEALRPWWNALGQLGLGHESMRTWGWMLACAVLVSCAQVGSPSGGPKDETPPQLVAAVPELGATQVDDRRMVLEFDEYVKASNWRSQLLVSPPSTARWSWKSADGKCG